MSVHQKATGRASSVWAGLAAGVTVSVVVTLLMTALTALLLDRERVAWETVGYWILSGIMLSAFLGAVTACRRIRRQKLMITAMSGLAYFAVLLSITALFFGGQYEAVGVTALLVAGGSGCAALLEMGRGTGTVRGKRRKRYR